MEIFRIPVNVIHQIPDTSYTGFIIPMNIGMGHILSCPEQLFHRLISLFCPVLYTYFRGDVTLQYGRKLWKYTTYLGILIFSMLHPLINFTMPSGSIKEGYHLHRIQSTSKYTQISLLIVLCCGLFWDPFYQHDLTLIPAGISNHTLIPAGISNHTPCKLWDWITYPFSNFNGFTVGVWELISNFITHFILGVISYPCWS